MATPGWIHAGLICAGLTRVGLAWAQDPRPIPGAGPAALTIQDEEGRRLILEARPQPVEDQNEDFAFPPVELPTRRALQRYQLAAENLDHRIFGEGVADRARRRHLDRALVVRLERVAQEFPLEPAQQEKLRLAGQGDIKRFLDRVEERRATFELARSHLGEGAELLRELEPLRAEFRVGPFGPSSLFGKTLARIGTGPSSRSKGQD